MTIFQAILLGVLQGLTEFIPISSTAHLTIAQYFLKIRDADIAHSFDAVLHLGTALALIVATWRLLVGIASEALLVVTGRPAVDETDRALLVPIVVGTIPGVLAGLFLLKRFESFRTLASIGVAMLVACVYFLVSERIGEARRSSERDLSRINLFDALLVGLAQAAAGLLPGLSRSGMTISTGRLRGLSREDATRFSFLLALPIILGAGAKALLDMRKEHGPSIGTAPLVAGFIASAVVGYVAVEFLLRYLRTHTLRPFAVYLAFLGVALVVASRFVS
ncbi:MAG: undecaprenyl-diphosphate phosphatase [Acidobacteriota bacterium]|nr:undecaprenyl-diphosphate phosphatase [Acidobacteriota bacterium]